MIKLIIYFFIIYYITSVTSTSWRNPGPSTCSCPPQKPLIKYIAIEVPKMVQTPAPKPPPKPPATTNTKYIAIQEISIPSLTPIPSPPPAPAEPGAVQGWNG